MKYKICGLIFLMIFALAVLGGIFNGTFENLADKNIGYYLGYFGTLAALLGFGIYYLMKKP